MPGGDVGDAEPQRAGGAGSEHPSPTTALEIPAAAFTGTRHSIDFGLVQ